MLFLKDLEISTHVAAHRAHTVILQQTMDRPQTLALGTLDVTANAIEITPLDHLNRNRTLSIPHVIYKWSGEQTHIGNPKRKCKDVSRRNGRRH